MIFPQQKKVIICIPGHHGDNKKKLVTNIPQDSLFALDKQLLDYTSCILFACQEEMYFGIGQRSSENDELLN